MLNIYHHFYLLLDIIILNNIGVILYNLSVKLWADL